MSANVKAEGQEVEELKAEIIQNDEAKVPTNPEHEQYPGARAELVEWIEEVFGEETEVLLADGFEGAFIGIGQQAHNAPVAVYDAELCVRHLIEGHGMSEIDAEEFFSFNVAGAYVGEQTPLFILRRHVEQDEQ